MMEEIRNFLERPYSFFFGSTLETSGTMARMDPHTDRTCSLEQSRMGTQATQSADILFAVTEFLGTGSQVPLLLVIDAI
jgi:hypothetical protein